VEGTMPTGLTLTSLGLVRGVPVEAGEFTFRVRVVDDRGEVAESEFTMAMVDPLVVDTSDLPTAIVGYDYGASLEASGGTAPYAWSVVADEADEAVPAGLHLSTDGRLTGVPERSGSAEFTVQVVDAAGRSRDRGYRIDTVNPLVILTPSLPGGVTGAGYSVDLAGSGGRAPLTWSVSSGKLPQGLELSAAGVISGVPSVATDATVVLRVADADGRVAAFPYRIVVVTGTNRQEVVARGGVVVVEILDDRVTFQGVSAADGFTAYVIHRGPDRVQVHFIGAQGVWPSWVICEGSPAVACSFD